MTMRSSSIGKMPDGGTTRPGRLLGEDEGEDDRRSNACPSPGTVGTRPLSMIGSASAFSSELRSNSFRPKTE